MKRLFWPVIPLAALSLSLSACGRPSPGPGEPISIAPEPGRAPAGGGPTAAAPAGNSAGGNVGAVPNPAPAQPVPNPGAVVLAYSFHKGEKSRYRVEMGQDVHMDVGGGTENLPGPVPTAIHQAVTLDFLHTIRAVEANSAARVLAKVGDVSLVNDMGSQKLELSIQNGKVTQKMNGETSPSGSRDAEVMMKAVFQQSTELRLARNGKILSTSRSKSQQPGGLQDPLGIGGVMGSGTGGYGTLILPNRPVRVGDTWKDIQTLDLPAPSSADPRKMTKSRLTIRTDYRLKEVVERNGRRLALIESELVGSFGGDAGAGATRLQSVSLRSKGTTEFDIVGGFVAAGQYATEYKMASEMGAPMGGGGPRGPASMNMTATGTMKLSRL